MADDLVNLPRKDCWRIPIDPEHWSAHLMRNVQISIESIKAAGVVGAGGAGFPTDVKMSGKADTFILNAAECEPLLHKDKELLQHHTDEVIQGLSAVKNLVGAGRVAIGVKNKYEHVIAKLEGMIPASMDIKALRDTYPAGDEFILVYDVTGRVIAPGGLPLHVGCIVSNVETVLNIARNRPVTTKYLTVAGAVKEPVTLCVPVGTPISEVIAAAGGPTVSESVILLNGVMMGRLCDDPSTPVTKTTGGVYVLPADHILVRRYRRETKEINRIGRSACDQCSFCTEMCPRYLLGHPIEPHKAMRALEFTMIGPSLIVGTTFCCECNLCTMIACPEDLDPKNVCVQDKQLVKEQGLKWEQGGREIKPHSMLDGRRTPTSRLMQKLRLQIFENKGPLRDGVLETGRVRLPLKQHVGAPCNPSVNVGAKVRRGDVIGAPQPGQLGALIHASIDGTVTAVTDAVEITA